MEQAELVALDKQITRLEDIQAIKELQMKYGYYFETQRLNDIVDLFSENTESIEITDHGLFRGKKGVKTQFLEWMGGGVNRQAQPPPSGNPAMSGGLVCIMQLQGVVELAEDGQTACGRWVCFDMESRPGVA
jgi:hypothetical protein